MAGHWCQPKLQCLLGGWLGFVSQKWMVAGLTVICDLQEPASSVLAVILNLHWPDRIDSLHPMSP